MFNKSSRKPNSPFLSVHSGGRNGRDWNDKREGGRDREREARAAGSAVPIWTLTQALGMPRKGVRRVGARLGSPLAQRDAESVVG